MSDQEIVEAMRKAIREEKGPGWFLTDRFLSRTQSEAERLDAIIRRMHGLKERNA